MKQPIIVITTATGQEIGERPVVSAHWSNGELNGVVVDFMQDGNSNDYIYFINIQGVLKCNSNSNLTGVINN